MLREFKDIKDLKENEMLVKIANSKNYNFGFMTSLNKNGTIPKKFLDWGTNKPIQVIKNDYLPFWKIVDYRNGQSTSWLVVEHPKLKFRIEIRTTDIDFYNKIIIYKGFIINECKYDSRRHILVPKEDDDLSKNIQKLILDEYPEKFI